MIKINQVTSKAQSDKLVADVIGVVGGDSAEAVDEAGMIEIRSSTTAKISLAMDSSTVGARVAVADVLGRLKPDFYEFTPADPDKVDAVEDDLRFLRTLSLPKIANGFFFLKDDLSFLDKITYFERLMDAGVVLFQFEIGSLIDPDFIISRRDASRIDDFLARVPGLVCDQFDDLASYPLSHAKGFYLNLTRSSGSHPANYDYTELAFPISKAVRLTKQPRTT